MRRIYKYELVPTQDLIGVHPEVHVQMPRGAEILHVDAQGDRMFVWAIVDLEAEEGRYSFIVLGTGEQVLWERLGLQHIGTVMMRSLVWHVFSDGQARP